MDIYLHLPCLRFVWSQGIVQRQQCYDLICEDAFAGAWNVCITRSDARRHKRPFRGSKRVACLPSSFRSYGPVAYMYHPL